jgi:pimeloyl-ACP methyl ester carboxylesterase
MPPKGENRPKCVLVHGYGGSGAIFYKIMKDIIEAGIHLILIDIIGMGSSSRPDFDKE